MPENVTLIDAMLAEIEARGVSAIVHRKRYIMLTVAERDALIAALRASRERERRYETPTTTAMEAAAHAMPCLCEMPVEGQHTTPCPRVYAYEVAVAMATYAAERIAVAADVAAQYTWSAALQGHVVDRLTQLEGERDATLGQIASTADFLNTCLRESGLDRAQVEAADLKPGIDALYMKLNAALAKLEAAEAEVNEHKGHCATLLDANNKAVVRYTAAEERVRVLEATLQAVQQDCSGEPYCLIEGHRIARAALAKATIDEEGEP